MSTFEHEPGWLFDSLEFWWKMGKLTKYPLVQLDRHMQRDAVLGQTITTVSIHPFHGAETIGNASPMGTDRGDRAHQQLTVGRDIVHNNDAATGGDHAFNRVPKSYSGHQRANDNERQAQFLGDFGRQQNVALLGYGDMSRPLAKVRVTNVAGYQPGYMPAIFWMSASGEKVEKYRDVELVKRTNGDPAAGTRPIGYNMTSPEVSHRSEGKT